MRTLINVCGAGRSGTTMLDLMLGNGPGCFSCGEVYALFRPWRKHHFTASCRCGGDTCSIWDTMSSHQACNFHSQLADFVKADFIVDSSKSLRWVLDAQTWAENANMSVVNFLVWKSPVALAYSHWKRGHALLGWRDDFILYHSRLISLQLPFISVRYQKLIDEPASVLRKLCHLAGLDYFAAKENFWQGEHHQVFGSLGTANQVRSAESSIYTATSYPDDFLALIPEIEAAIKKDRILRNLYDSILEKDFESSAALQDPFSQYSAPKCKPVWYYRDILRGGYRRVFPRS